MNGRDKEPRVRLESVPEGLQGGHPGTQATGTSPRYPRQKHPAMSPWHPEGGVRLVSEGRAGMGRLERGGWSTPKDMLLWVESAGGSSWAPPSQEGGAQILTRDPTRSPVTLPNFLSTESIIWRPRSPSYKAQFI